MVRTSTSVRRTSTIMKSTAGAFVVTNWCSPSVDMLGGCDCGCGNDRAHAGVGFGSLSIRFGETTLSCQYKSFYSDLLIKFVEFVESLIHRQLSFLQLPPPPCTCPFKSLRRIGRCGRYLGAERDEGASTSKEESLQVDT